jgi:hypothetical protein
MAAAPVMVVRIAASLAELKKNLAEGKNQIETTTQAMAKLATSFQGDKLIQQAHNVAAAVNQIGGAAKLTEAEQARVNRVVQAALEKYAVLGKEAPAALRQLAEATRQVEAPTQGLFGTFKTLVASWVTAQLTLAGLQRAWRLLTDFVGSSIKAFAEEELAQKKLVQALTQQGNASTKVVTQYKAMASELQSLTRYGDEATLEMAALLVQIGDVGPKQMRVAIEATQDLAAGLGIDLKAAATLVGKAFAGETGTLSRYGIIIDQARYKTEGISVVLEALHDKFGGQAQAQAQTYAGRIEQLGNAWGDFKERIGEAIVQNPLIVAALSSLNEIVGALNSSVSAGVPAWETFSRLWVGETSTQILRLVGAMAEADQSIRSLVRAAQAAPSPFQRMAEEMANGGRVEQEAAKQVRLFVAEIQREIQVRTAAAAAAKKAAEAAAKAAEATKQYVAELMAGKNVVMNYRLGLDQLPGTLETVTTGTLAWYDQQQALSRLLQQTTVDELARFIDQLMKVGETYDIIGIHAKKFAHEDAPTVSASLDRMSAGFAQLAQIGGGALKGITGFAAQLTGTIKQSLDGAKSLSAGWKQAGQGGALNFIGGLAQMIPGAGAIIGAVTGLFGKLFGKSEGRKQLEAANAEIAKLKDQVVSLYGSTAEAEAIAARLGINFQGIWGNQNQAGLASVQQQIEALAKALEDQKRLADELGQTLTQRLGVEGSAAIQPMLDKLASLGALSVDVQAELLAMAGPDFKAMEEAAARYGLAQDALGNGYWQAKLDSQFLQVVKDFELLTGAGADAGAVITAMGPQVANLVEQAMKYGTELPAGMRPIVESMIEAGLLVDENGEKLKGLESLTFAETLTQGIDRVVEKLQELIDKLTVDTAQGFGRVIDAAERFGRTKIMIPVEWDVSDVPGAGGERAEGYATGTYGFRDFGAGKTIRVHDREAIVREDNPAQRAAVAPGGGADFGRIERLLRDQPRAIAVAVSDALALARRR